MSRKVDGIVIHKPHCAWLAYIIEKPEFEAMIKDLQEKEPRCIFHHEGTFQQMRVSVREQIANSSKDTESS